MKTLTTYKVPTGHIVVVQGERGKLELLSIGDYGQAANCQAEFLGLDSLDGPVLHQKMLPLEEKWVITISTQYGCSMRCTFCDVPMVGGGKNATLLDLQQQILTGLCVHPEVTHSDRLNVHYARMGEPTWNPSVLDHAKWMKDHIDPEFHLHPVVSTMMPKRNIWLRTFIHNWMRIKNRVYKGNAGLQLSINSTSEEERTKMFSNNASSLLEISRIMEGIVPVGRKVTLNFAVAGYEIDPGKLLRYFDPGRFIVKLTPMHVTSTATKNGIRTHGESTSLHPYEEYESRLKDAGYDVLVFIASREEDEGRITCGNAILSGNMPTCDYSEVDEDG